MAWVRVLAAVTAAALLASCGGGTYGNPGGYSYSPYGNGATQQSSCGALGTCPPSNYPQIGPGDRSPAGW